MKAILAFSLIISSCFYPKFSNALDPFTEEGAILNLLLLSRNNSSSNNALCATNPQNLSGLTFWLKADSLSQADATPVASWLDSSGNGNDVIAGANATFHNSSINSMPIIRFNGSTSRLIKTGAIGMSTTHTLFIVLQRNLLGTQQMIFQNAPGGCTGGESVYFMVSNVLRTDKCSDPTSPLHSNTIFDSFNPQLIAISFDGNSRNIFVNGALDASFSYPTTYTLTNIYIGSDLTPGNFFNGDYAEVIYFNRNLSNYEMAQINSYLHSKYAISLSIDCSGNGA